MCGIAGYIGEQKIVLNHIDSTLQQMQRRGPDHQGHVMDRLGSTYVYLLHSRLSIVDLEPRSNQPFCRENCILIFNGEIYNYVELQVELDKRGIILNTKSDTEVLLQYYLLYGEKCVEYFEGMWSFVILDKSKGRIFFSRDRFGEKPLYLFPCKNGLYFASEVKFISTLMDQALSVNHEHLFRYMVNGYKFLYKGEHSFFKGLRELPPASNLMIDVNGKRSEYRYWTPKFCPDDSMTYVDAVEGARAELIKAVKLRLRADVPLAFCMSGGVDSNSLISIAKKQFNYDVHGFTIVNTDERYEEQALVDCVIKELGIRHTPILTDTYNFLSKLRVLVRQHDAPVYTITYYAHWLLMQSIAEHGYKISLSGTGADDIFSGYIDHHLAYLYEVRNDASLFDCSLKAWTEHIKPIVRNPYLRQHDLFIKNPGMRDHINLDSDQFAKYLTVDWHEEFTETNYTDSLLRNRMMNELFHEASRVILHEDDLNAMYFSIENRSPFLDKNLYDFCSSIPSRYLVRDGAAKAVLRDAMKSIVPEPVLASRQKIGFNAPIFSFLDVGNIDVRSYLLDDSTIFDYVKKDKIETLLSKENLPNSESKFLFYFINSKMFLEEFE